jgi:serine/threonine protein kinase
MADLTGQSLGRYHILEQLGEGGMATVYKAYDTRLERDVAVKVIRRGAFPAEQLEQILKRFERESKALARLSHTNIVKVMDYGEYEGSPYMVMEYLPGGTLKQKMRKLIPWKESIQLLLPIVKALGYAHEQGIVHRDIKPSNILLTSKNQPLLTDFGIAKILETRELTTLTGSSVGVGTPEYMAPEQWTGKADVRSDVYSLGIVLYEMVTGRKPYEADTPAAILLMQATEPLPPPSRYVPDLPEGLERILIKALSKDPKDRFQNMAEFASAMEKLSTGAQVGAWTDRTTHAPTMVDPYPTIQQDDSRATRIEKSSSVMGSGTWAATEYIPHTSDRKRFPSWVIPGIGGLVVISICIGLAFALGILGHDEPATPAPPAPTELPVEPVVPTEEPVLPTQPPVAAPTYTPLPTYTPQPTFTPQPTYTLAPAKSPPVVDSIGVPEMIVCDGRRYDVPVHFYDPDGDAYQIYWELINSKLNTPLYSTLREFSIDAQTQRNGAVFMDWLEWNTAGDAVRIRVYIYDRTGLKGWMDFFFRCSN